MKALTLWQPWASLIAESVKTIETRSWPAPKSLIGERFAVHAAATTAGFDTLPGDCEGVTEAGWRYGYIGAFQAAYCYRSSDEGERGETFLHCLEGPNATNEPGPCPLGAVVATARLVACVPTEAVRDISPTLTPSWYPIADGHPTADGGRYTHSARSDQFMFGDFAPGRWAWLLDRIERVAPLDPACSHYSSDGIDQTDGPAKVWRCTACNGLHRSVKADDGISHIVPVAVAARGRQRVWNWTP